MKPAVVHRKRKPFDVLIDRTTPRGNHFRIDSTYHPHGPEAVSEQTPEDNICPWIDELRAA